MYSVKILADSISPSGKRITTWQLEYPRMVHAELLVHRLFSRNAASSRALPIEKMLQKTEQDPAVPLWWGKNQPGMAAREELDEAGKEAALEWWLRGMRLMVEHAREGAKLGLHKQIVNRVQEPWMFITVILTGTEFDNFLEQRNHPDAQPEIAWVAKEMQKIYVSHTPVQLELGGWHLPLITPEDRAEASRLAPNPLDALELLKKASTGKCARVSYLSHAGTRDLAADVELHDKLVAGKLTGDPLHLSPFEHVATPLEDPTEWCANVKGWKSYRKEIQPSDVR